MYLREVAMDTFVLLQAPWPVKKARQLVKLLNPTHVIVHRRDPRDYYYLYNVAEAIPHLAGASDEMSIHEAFKLHEYQATPTLDSYARLETAPARVVILEEGEVKGFLDTKAAPPPPSAPRTNRGLPYEETAPVTFSLAADFPEQVRLEETHSLLVSLSIEMSAGVGTSSALKTTLPRGSKVDVVVQPKRGFALEGMGEGILTVSDKDETLPLQFKLKAIELGPGRVRILAFHLGQLLETLTLAPVVVAATVPASAERRTHEERVEPTSIGQPDLSLLILEDHSGGKPSFTFRLSAVDSALNLNFKSFGPITLHTDPLQYFEDFFKDIETMSLRTAEERTLAELRLGAKGSHLFETVVPQDLQTLLWSLRNRIQSVQVQSEEPWIPWELCKLQGRENERIVEGPFLCEAFAMTRWLLETPVRPNLTLKKMALVVPGDSQLPFAPMEGEYVMSLAGGKRNVERVKARFPQLISAFAKGEYDGWHFTGHGGFRDPDSNRSAMLLENAEEMTPEDLSGAVGNLGLARPFVFLNACQIGRSAMSLTGIGGWAAKFLRAGAGAFMGAYWSIYDQAAHDFAKAFYDQLLSGTTVGRAVQAARAKVKPLGDPTWLAYTVFAHPLARVV